MNLGTVAFDIEEKQMTDVPITSKRQNPKSHGWKILLLLIFSVGIFFLSVEIILRIFGFGAPGERVDPFQGFEGTNQNFQVQEIAGEGSFYVPSPNKSFLAQRFSTSKAKNMYRIFTFGGSTTEGVPWGREHSFSNHLQKSLQEKIPSKKIEVINVGVAGYGSSRVLEIYKEVINYDPDLLIVYTGQNEFRDAHFHKRELRRSSFWANLLKMLYRSRTVFLVSERFDLLLQKISGKRIVSYAAESIESVVSQPFSNATFQSFDYYRMPDFTTPVVIESPVGSNDEDETSSFSSPKSFIKRILGPDGWQRLKDFIGLDELSEKEVYGIFQENIRTMIDLAETRGLKIIFVAKAQNPKIMNLQYPYRIDPQKFIEDGKTDEWKRLYADGLQAMKSKEFSEALVAFNKVRALYKSDFRDRDTFLNLYLGECYEQLGDYEQAKLEYRKRLPTNHQYLNSLLKSMARKRNVPVLDALHVLEKNAKHGIVGYNCFVDTVHMTLGGYKVVGLALADFITTQGIVPVHHKKEANDSKQDHFENVGLEDSVSLNDFSADVFTSLGWSAFNQGKFSKALFWGRQAVEKSREDVQAHLLLGYVHTKLENESDAKKEWQQLKTLWEKMSTH